MRASLDTGRVPVAGSRLDQFAIASMSALGLMRICSGSRSLVALRYWTASPRIPPSSPSSSSGFLRLGSIGAQFKDGGTKGLFD